MTLNSATFYFAMQASLTTTATERTRQPLREEGVAGSNPRLQIAPGARPNLSRSPTPPPAQQRPSPALLAARADLAGVTRQTGQGAALRAACRTRRCAP